MIYVAIGFHDENGQFASHAGAMLASLFSRTEQPVCAHVLHNGSVTPENRAKLKSIAEKFGKEMRFNQVVLPPEVRHMGGRLTEGALLRLLLPDVLGKVRHAWIKNRCQRTALQIDLP